MLSTIYGKSLGRVYHYIIMFASSRPTFPWYPDRTTATKANERQNFRGSWLVHWWCWTHFRTKSNAVGFAVTLNNRDIWNSYIYSSYHMMLRATNSIGMASLLWLDGSCTKEWLNVSGSKDSIFALGDALALFSRTGTWLTFVRFIRVYRDPWRFGT